MNKKDLFNKNNPIKNSPIDIALGINNNPIVKKETPSGKQAELYTIQETADILNIHPNRIREYIKEGHIKAINIGKGSRGKQAEEKKTNKTRPTYRVSRKEIDRVIENGI